MDQTFSDLLNNWAISEQEVNNTFTLPYAVKRGDNLTKIAKKLNTNVQTLMALNPELKDKRYRNGDMIFPGQELRVPNKKRVTDITPKPPGRSALLDQDIIDSAGDMKTDFGPVEILAQLAGLPTLAMKGMADVIPAVTKLAPGRAALRVHAPDLAGAGAMVARGPGKAGTVQFPMSKGAVDWPGAAKTFSNVRPVSNVNMYNPFTRETLERVQMANPNNPVARSLAQSMEGSSLNPNPLRMLQHMLKTQGM